MKNQNLKVEEFNDLLQKWNGKRLKVVKHEQADVDEILIHLDKVTYEQEEATIDGYEPRYSLHLIGEGKIETTENNYEDLPDDLYEIPLEDDALYEFDGNQFMISTSRAVYKIELV